METIFNNCRDIWESVILHDGVYTTYTIPAGQCVDNDCANTIDYVFTSGKTWESLLIITNITSIDGAGGTLASAGPITFHPNAPRVLANVGYMQFDTDDIDLSTQPLRDQFQATALHEIGHILGKF